MRGGERRGKAGKWVEKWGQVVPAWAEKAGATRPEEEPHCKHFVCLVQNTTYLERLYDF